MERISTCRVCTSAGLRPFFDLGEQPLANSLLSRPDESEEFFPLSLSWCPACRLVQLNHTVPPEKLFSEYVWVTGTSKTAKAFADTFFRELVARAGKEREGYVLEIASNDGTFLEPFISHGYTVVGIDPARNVAEMANKNGVPTEALFWGMDAARELVLKRGSAAIIFARNVLPHVANTRDFVQGLAHALRDDGTLAIEVHYGKSILEELHYDSIYHEHLCYFTLRSLERLLADYGLHVFDVMKSPISGGSIIVYTRKRPAPEQEALRRFRNGEAEGRTNEFASWEGFARRACEHRTELQKILKTLSPAKTVVGYGASARSSTLLNFCGIDAALLPIIADKNPLKQKKYTAGSHIAIESPEVVMARKPSHVFILAWNFEAEIINYLGETFGFKGTYIVPLPREPRIVTG